jgi:hypothetical protein
MERNQGGGSGEEPDENDGGHSSDEGGKKYEESEGEDELVKYHQMLHERMLQKFNLAYERAP